MCKSMCKCMCSEHLSVHCTFRFLPTILHACSLLWACAWSSAGARACACARAGAGVCLLQQSFRCLSATITVGTAYFSPPWFMRVTSFFSSFFSSFFPLDVFFLFFFLNTDLPLIGIFVLVTSLYLDCTGWVNLRGSSLVLPRLSYKNLTSW